ncbi:MAG TPA: ATP synthase F0 subunit B [Bryobacteraceae bacterium]|jgi:F-type H+-transporting ATPase subunit b|nr:ATP synthase F0 subunit B [Bryobacteraceae bacterium]
MESTLQELGTLLVQAIPTIIFFILMVLFLNATLFKPLARVLEDRRKATEGVRELAQKAVEAADRKGDEFEKAMQMARAELHEKHAELHRRWLEEQQAEIEKARVEAQQAIERARQEIEGEARQAQAELDSRIQTLSDQMVASLLRRKAA